MSKKFKYRIILFILLFFISEPGFSINKDDPFALPQSMQIQFVNIKISYTDATKLTEKINNKNFSLLSAGGHAIADERTNTIWLEDDAEHISKTRLFIQSIDIPLSRILIKSRIVFLDDNSIHEIGVFFSSPDRDNQKVNSIPYLFAELPILKIGSQQLLDLKLRALEGEGHAIIVSAPEILTNDRHTAIIESGSELPYQERTGEGNTSINFKKAVLRLKVTPFILPHGKILLTLNVNQDKPSNLIVNGTPSITTQQLETQVSISNRQTLILGGIREQSENNNTNGIPILDRLPILGNLFKYRNREMENKQLLIFITPEIIADNHPSP